MRDRRYTASIMFLDADCSAFIFRAVPAMSLCLSQGSVSLKLLNGLNWVFCTRDIFGSFYTVLMEFGRIGEFGYLHFPHESCKLLLALCRFFCVFATACSFQQVFLA